MNAVARIIGGNKKQDSNPGFSVNHVLHGLRKKRLADRDTHDFIPTSRMPGIRELSIGTRGLTP
jgi:hypothetical protein